MAEFLKMDIFFAVTTLAVVAIGALLAVVLIRAWRILGNVEHILKNAAEESDAIRKDIGDLRTKIRNGANFGWLAALLSSFFKARRPRRKK